ncbi:hypothetical protein EJ110_NYTH04972 [Nymphaea thermarum]|nr:hypothetical protein EJ110_NYTH04972 [Nymphaea thermarum]
MQQADNRFHESIRQCSKFELRCMQHAPAVQMQEVPPDFYIPDIEDEENPDERVGGHAKDGQIQRDDESYDGDNDNDRMEDSF